MKGLGLPAALLAAFCGKHHIARLSLFGSVLKGQAHETSDLDLVVEFDAGSEPGLIALAGMEAELSQLVGRKVDLRTSGDLSRYFRADVLRQAEVQFSR